LRVPDIDALAAAAHDAGARFVIDATFATPMLFRGLEHGADIVVHSATKYLGGHGDLTSGVCATRDEKLLGELKQALIMAGAVLSPFDAWLALRGMRTLALRMERACANAKAVAAFLEEHPKVARTIYPGLPSHPHHEHARTLLGGSGGAMIAFELAGGTRESAMKLLGRFALIKPATTLGDVTTLALHPASSSHRELDADELRTLGIGESLVRLSIGIEDARDIIADLEQAL
jgi:cystathionine gamma-synthase/methionine-gamma-lyase